MEQGGNHDRAISNSNPEAIFRNQEFKNYAQFACAG